LIHSRGATGAALFSGAGGAVPSNSKIRTDIVPVMVFETETDTAGHFNARQPDGPNYRLWEPAGTAHADFYDFTYFTLNAATQEPSYPATTCTFPSNMANQKYVMNAALDALRLWIAGTPAPNAPSPITVTGGVIQRNANAIALGGIRLPEMDVPTVTHKAPATTGSAFCVLFGRTIRCRRRSLPEPLGLRRAIRPRPMRSSRRVHPAARRRRGDRDRAEFHRRHRLRQRRAETGEGATTATPARVTAARRRADRDRLDLRRIASMCAPISATAW
jgi:hypothetical protein